MLDLKGWKSATMGYIWFGTRHRVGESEGGRDESEGNSERVSQRRGAKGEAETRGAWLREVGRERLER